MYHPVVILVPTVYYYLLFAFFACLSLLSINAVLLRALVSYKFLQCGVRPELVVIAVGTRTTTTAVTTTAVTTTAVLYGSRLPHPVGGCEKK
jgi:hypothetical protein